MDKGQSSNNSNVALSPNDSSLVNPVERVLLSPSYRYTNSATNSEDNYVPLTTNNNEYFEMRRNNWMNDSDIPTGHAKMKNSERIQDVNAKKRFNSAAYAPDAYPLGSLQASSSNRADGEELNNFVGQLRPPSADTATSCSVASSVQNNNMSDSDISNKDQVVSRLMLIRNYIKQASSMMENLKNSPNEGDKARSEQLKQVVSRLTRQENRYLSLLLDYTEINTLRNQQRHQQNQANRLGTEVTDNLLETPSEVCSINENARSPVASSNSNLSQNKCESLEKNELEALQEQHDLLTKMVQQQKQLRALQDRQSRLLTMQRETEEKLAEQKASEQFNHYKNTESDANPSLRADAADASLFSHDLQSLGLDAFSRDNTVPKTSYVDRQITGCVTPQNSAISDVADSNATEDCDADLIVNKQRLLRNKLADLYEKRDQMDELLAELHTLQEAQKDTKASINNNTEDKFKRTKELSNSATQTSVEASDVLEMLDSRVKLAKLNDVKKRLDQLRELLPEAMIEDQNDEICGAESAKPFTSDQCYNNASGRSNDYTMNRPQTYLNHYNLPESTSRLTNSNRKNEHQNAMNNDGACGSTDMLPFSVTDNASSVVSETLDGWEGDQEVVDKVRKLKKAKDKLSRLHQLVCSVQNAPESIHRLPPDLTQLINEMTDDGSSPEDRSTSPAINSMSIYSHLTDTPSSPKSKVSMATAGDYMDQSPVITSGEFARKMREQREELDMILKERKRLLELQAQLRELSVAQGELNLSPRIDRDSSPKNVAAQESPEQIVPAVKKNNIDIAPPIVSLTEPANKTSTESPMVTFGDPIETVVSNEELYGQMRQQRILREELRDKKKELESMMHKDRPRKQYSRNQDNQSDNVSYSNKSDPYGRTSLVSGDNTMATWGGSTAENIESVEDNVEGQPAGAARQICDDGYQADGIVQVEEEGVIEDSDRDTYTIDNAPLDLVGQKSTQPRGGSTSNRKRVINYKDNRKLVVDSTSANMTACLADTATEDSSETKRNELKEIRRQLDVTQDICRSLVVEQQKLNRVLSPHAVNSGRVGFAPFSPITQTFLNPLSTTCSTAAAAVPDVFMQTLQQCNQQMSACQQQMTSIQGRLDNLSAAAEQTPRPYPPDNFNNYSHYQPSVYKHEQTITGVQTTVNPTYPVTKPSTGVDSHLQAASGTKPSGAYYYDDEAVLSKYREDEKIFENSDGIPIQTVQAMDTKIPSLNLKKIISPLKSSSKKKQSADVKSERYQTPTRADAANRLANQRVPGRYGVRPGISAGISGTAFHDTASVASSAISSIVDEEKLRSTLGYYQNKQASETSTSAASHNSARNNDGPAVEISLFESLRETIYSEVATLISQNETRPHFLIELFRELQMLATDYLRQRALYAIQDLVTRFLTEENLRVTPQQAVGKAARVSHSQRSGFSASKWLHDADTRSEQTPSESQITSDIEAQQQQGYSSVGYQLPKLSMRTDSISSQPSSLITDNMATPSREDQPFNQDSLGDTVINLDKELARMRQYEARLREAKNRIKQSPLIPSDQLNQVTHNDYGKTKPIDLTQATGSNYNYQQRCSPQPSESEYSEFHCPPIDTERLDAQIKRVVSNIIPVFKEHLDEVCTPELLAYVQQMVLAFAEQRNQRREFVRFFNKQLSNILRGSLAKFENRKVRECAEEILVEISEILLNELAFFRLMLDLDLDRPRAKIKERARRWRHTSQSSTDTASHDEELLVTSGTARLSQPQESSQAGESNSEMVSITDCETEECETGESETEDATEVSGADNDYMVVSAEEELDPPNTASEDVTPEEDELSKARDDEFAACVDICDHDDDSECKVPQPRSVIELAPSETKPFTRIGSDEDEEGEEGITDAVDPSETAVSLDAERFSEADLNTSQLTDNVSDGRSPSSSNTTIVTMQAPDTGAVESADRTTVVATEKSDTSEDAQNTSSSSENTSDRSDQSRGLNEMGYILINGEANGVEPPKKVEDSSQQTTQETKLLSPNKDPSESEA